ncbi:MAG: glycosyltransferase [Chitinophagaceae bacterium]|nr:glycosyltransferase [Rubrivivax sp.]
MSSSQASPFQSFWMGGFEGADHINGNGEALDMAVVSGHIEQLDEDHRHAAQRGILTIRESIGWRVSEPGLGCIDLQRAVRIARSADQHGLQVLWTLMHYGTPPDVSLLDDSFCDRFAAFAAAAALALKPCSARPPVFNLINEIGFVAWAVSQTALMHPYQGHAAVTAEAAEAAGYGVKRRLVRGALMAMAEVRRIDPSARFLHIEPVVHVVAPRARPELAGLAETVSAYQWQVWDMLAGTAAPELGGHAQALDLIGVNHYHGGQWELRTNEPLSWHGRDPRRRPFSALLAQTWQRYRRPLIVAETSHVGEGRAAWLHDVASEVAAARDAGIPVDGICLYPLVDRPDWNDTGHWHHSGLWDVEQPHSDPSPSPIPSQISPARRVLCIDYAAALTAWQQHLPKHPPLSHTTTCLIVFSHLRWNFVYQRPQHLMSRLSRSYRVLFIEEPLYGEGPPGLDRISQGPGLEVLVPRTPCRAAGFHDDQMPALQTLLAGFLRDQRIDDCVVWFYTPMAVPLLAGLRPSAVVYDCMDELTAFKDAPAQLRQREATLLQLADLVFTGGPALFEAKRRLHPHVHCLPSSVDAAHFSPRGLDPASAAAHEARSLQSSMPHPRLGFFGVIDERFDAELLAQLADAHPEWQLVMVGPVVKIDPAQLPQRPNVHWLGMRPYALLPHLMAGWDLCLMPFALNAATRFISPTKTLEYMSGEKPVVSTPVPDVLGLYGAVVRIGAGATAFIAACEQALADSGPTRDRRARRASVAVQRSSWDASVQTVRALLDQQLQERRSPAQNLPQTLLRSALAARSVADAAAAD